MKVLIITNYFPPEIGGASHLYYELAESLTQKGNAVTVVTGFPRYNVKKADVSKGNGWWSKERMGNIEVVRILIPSMPRNVLFLRGLEHFTVAFSLFWGGLFARKADAMLVYSPPLTLALASCFLGKLKKISIVVNVQDLFPQEAIDLGLLKNSFLIDLFFKMEKLVYRLADVVAVHSHGNADYVKSKENGVKRVAVVPNWIDLERLKPTKKENAFRQEYKLGKKFVVSYAGTMGWCQDMGTIVRAAALLRGNEDILFLLVGDGVEKDQLVKDALSLKLTNIVFLPMQPWDKYPQVLQASDLCLVNLKDKLKTPVVPSKIMGIMATGRPILASMPLNGDAPRIIREAGCGTVIEPGNARKLAESILKFYQSPELLDEMGRKGREYAEKHFSREVGVRRYEEIFKWLARA